MKRERKGEKEGELTFYAALTSEWAKGKKKRKGKKQKKKKIRFVMSND